MLKWYIDTSDDLGNEQFESSHNATAVVQHDTQGTYVRTNETMKQMERYGCLQISCVRQKGNSYNTQSVEQQFFFLRNGACPWGAYTCVYVQIQLRRDSTC